MLTWKRQTQSLKLCGAGGTLLDVVGTVVVQLTIQDTRCLHEIKVVQKLRHPCILGRDVLARIPCEISSQEGKLIFRTQPADVSTVQQATGTALRLRRLERIPAHTEMVVWAVGDVPLPTGSSWLVEATISTSDRIRPQRATCHGGHGLRKGCTSCYCKLGI